MNTCAARSEDQSKINLKGYVDRVCTESMSDPAAVLKILRSLSERVPNMLGKERVSEEQLFSWKTLVCNQLETFLGEGSEHVHNFRGAGVPRVAFHGFGADENGARRSELSKKNEALVLIINAIEEGYIAPKNPPHSGMRSHAVQSPAPTGPRRSEPRKEVFVVHGHDEAAREKVARFLEQLDLKPLILREKPNSGRTLIEKFETVSSQSDFAVVILTPDDQGAAKGEALKPRARQNVMLELGFFVGRIGRDRVCVLYAEGVEIPSDYSGVGFTPLDAHNGWQMELARELRAAGFEVDLNRIG